MPRSPVLSENAYETLKAQIERGEVGVEEPLTEARLAKLFQVSRVPAREILLRLEAEGLLRRGRNQARYVVHVEDLTAEELRHRFEVREVVDGLAARLAAERMSDRDLAELRKTIRRMEECWASNDRIGRLSAAAEFQSLFRRKCGNPLLDRAAHSFGLLLFREDSALAEFCAFHSLPPGVYYQELEAVVNVIATRDAAAAEQAMRQFLRKHAERIVGWAESRAVQPID